jgi:hypothetical protein
LLAQGGEAGLARTLRTLQPISLLALLATLVLLFGFQGEQIVRQPLIIALLAVPIIIQVYLRSGCCRATNPQKRLVRFPRFRRPLPDAAERIETEPRTAADIAAWADARADRPAHHAVGR